MLCQECQQRPTNHFITQVVDGQTLESWGIRATEDIGTVVFRMIEAGMLGARPEDTPEDFHSLYDFAAAFPTTR